MGALLACSLVHLLCYWPTNHLVPDPCQITKCHHFERCPLQKPVDAASCKPSVLLGFLRWGERNSTFQLLDLFSKAGTAQRSADTRSLASLLKAAFVATQTDKNRRRKPCPDGPGYFTRQGVIPSFSLSVPLVWFPNSRLCLDVSARHWTCLLSSFYREEGWESGLLLLSSS